VGVEHRVRRRPNDATRFGLADGDPAKVISETGALVGPIEVTDAVKPGVVSLPYGWGPSDPARSALGSTASW
jgi:anaerobic selenocysteine-containing dehydrogenase